MGAMLYYLGLALALVGWIWLVVLGFKTSALWGILNLLFSPISSLIYTIKNKTWVPFMIYVVGVILILIATPMMVTTVSTSALSFIQTYNLS